MRLTLISTQIELGKIFSRKKYIILLLIQLIVIFLVMCGINVASEKLDMNLDLPTIPYSILNTVTAGVLPLLIFMLASDIFTSEIENLSLKCVLLRPISRSKAYLSKLFAILLFAVIDLVSTLAVITVIKIVLYGGISGISPLLTSYLLSVVPMAAFAAMGALVSLLFGNATMSMFCSVILYIVMQGISLLSPSSGAVFFTAHINWYKIFLGSTMNYGITLNTLLLFLSSAVLLALGGYALFDRKQL